jgi:prevent-host-death family protein
MWSRMATRMGIRELRDTLTQTIRRVRAGETIEVTNDGEPVAVIVPYRRSRLDQLIAEGRAIPARRPFRPPTRLLEAKGPKSASEILDEGRGDR